MSSVQALEDGQQQIEYAIHSERQQDWEAFLKLPKLGKTQARVDEAGTILYVTSYDLSGYDALPSGYVRIHGGGLSGTIYHHGRAARDEIKGVRINHSESVEKAIAAMDHILSGPTAEGRNLTIMGSRAHELLDLFELNFSALTEDELRQKKAETRDLLHLAHLDPDTVDEEMKQIRAWVIKGSDGHDNYYKSPHKRRRNKLIAMIELSAAYRHAIQWYKDIHPTLLKFTAMREAFILERISDRTIFKESLAYLRPTALPASNPLTNPHSREYEVKSAIRILNTMRGRLHMPRVKPYRPAGIEADGYIAQIIQLLKAGDRQTIAEENLFEHAHGIIQTTLKEHAFLYRPAEDAA